MSTLVSVKTISKSTKPRTAGKRDQSRGNTDNKLERNGVSRQWKQVVEITELGRNKKGKKVFSSKTKHIPA